MEQLTESEFSKIRSCLWPIHGHEMRKLLPMLLMLFLVCFNYSIIRNLKDSLVVTAPSSTAAVIPFIKVWVMLPAAVLSTIIFTHLSNRFKKEIVFYIVASFFLIFFSLFVFVIYPNRESLELTQLSQYLETHLSKGCHGLITMIRHWTLTCFYVISELWGSLVLGVVFWGFANEVTKVTEARRFYSVMGIGSNVAAIGAGQIAVFYSSQVFDTHFSLGANAWEQAFAKLMLIVIFAICCLILTYWWMNKNVLDDVRYLPHPKEAKKKDKKLNFRESIRYISQSKYLLCIAAIVVSYNLVISLVEVIWKDQLRLLYPDTRDYNVYINNLTSLMGIVSTTASILMVGIISKLGWTRTAMITPIILFVTTAAFFGCQIVHASGAFFANVLLGSSPLALVVFFGSCHNVFSKAAKYSLFDSTKEMTFVPLNREHKLKGKAAIDGIGAKLGKSGAACIHQGLLLIFFTLSATAPYVAVILLIVIALWVLAVLSLGKRFAVVEDEQKREEQREAELMPEEESLSPAAVIARSSDSNIIDTTLLSPIKVS